MDDIAIFNKERWEELARENIGFSRPYLDLDMDSARKVVDPEGMLGEIAGKDVLCLAGGGGQQSAAFGLLGANTTIIDLSETQLERDREAVKHYNLDVRTIQGDMRDLSCFSDNSFDIVWHAHSLSFVPDARQVFRGVARIIRGEGFYRLYCVNPFIHGLLNDGHKWDGKGYPLRRPYQDGEIIVDDPRWDVDPGDGNIKRIRGPREFRHTLGTLINGLIECGFVILGVWEDLSGNPDAKPGSWDHFTSIAPPWMTYLTSYRPYIYENVNHQ